MTDSAQRKDRLQSAPSNALDHDSHAEFYDYYAKESLSVQAHDRFCAIRDAIVRVDRSKNGTRPCDVADVGCGAGTQSMLWAELGHRVHGVDVNRPLLDLAQERAAKAGHQIEFLVGTAVSLPLPDGSVDVCLAVELLEHVADWQSCIREFTRVLRPDGILFLSTTNRLCPFQQEFNLPLYSWYPAPIKRYCERLATTTRPQLANYAKYPAVHWFDFYSLRSILAKSGFECKDRFDLIDTSQKGAVSRTIVAAVRAVRILGWMGQLASRGTTILATKRSAKRQTSPS